MELGVAVDTVCKLSGKYAPWETLYMENVHILFIYKSFYVLHLSHFNIYLSALCKLNVLDVKLPDIEAPIISETLKGKNKKK